MTDSEFLTYLELQTQTERCLFPKQDVVRLLNLCECYYTARDVANGSKRFYAFDAFNITLSIHQARTLIEQAEREIASAAEAKHDVARQYQETANSALDVV